MRLRSKRTGNIIRVKDASGYDPKKYEAVVVKTAAPVPVAEKKKRKRKA